MHVRFAARSLLLMGLLLLISCHRPVPDPERLPVSFRVEIPSIDLTDRVWDGHAICYSGFRAGQQPGGSTPSDAEILEDLEILARNWNVLRVYNTDAHGEAVLRVIAENGLPLKVLLGVYLVQTRGLSGSELAEHEAQNQHNVLEGVRLSETYAEWIVGINVGNEALVSWSFVPNEPATVIRYIRQLAAALAVRDLSIPLTVADNYAFWESSEGRRVAAELDFITVHAYAMWDGHGIAEALDFLAEHVAAVQASIPDKPVIVGETGWATYAEDAQIYGQIGAQANEVNQKIYFDAVSAWSRANDITTFLFEAFDEPWKAGGNEGAAEGHWGLFDTHRRAKRVMQVYYPQLLADAPTSPDYAGFEFEPAPQVASAFRSSTVVALKIATTANALNSCRVELSPNAYEGAHCLRFIHDGRSWGGFYSNFSPALDVSANEEIIVALSGVSPEVAYFELRLEGGAGGTSRNILSYPSVSDGVWTHYRIPLADFVDADLSQISALGFWHPFDKVDYDRQDEHYVASDILLDDIHFR